jgi:Flp pilus assembly protein TadD
VSVLLVALVGAAFWTCPGNDFLKWDDNENFVNNLHYRGLGWSQLRWDWTSFQIGVYQPLAWMILGAEYLLWGMQPRGYHLANVVFYAINTLVLYALTLALLARARPADARPGASLQAAAAAGAGAALAVALFAVHPLRVEVVAWVSCQPYLPCALFGMLAVLAYLRAFPGTGEARHPWAWLLATFVLFAAALLSKAVAVSLPAVLLILDFYPLRRLGDGDGGGGGPGRWFRPAVRRVWWEKVPFLALSALFMGLAIAGRVRERHLVPVKSSGLGARLAQSSYGLWFYLVKTLWPPGITAYYPVPSRVDWYATPYLPALLATVAVTAAALGLRRRWPALLAGWLSYLVILSPNLGIVRIGNQIAADRYSYIALMPLVPLAAWGIARVVRVGLRSRPVGAASAALFAAALVGLIGQTREQCQIWRSSTNLWTHAVRHGAGGNALAHINLGVALMDEGRDGDAVAEFLEALRIDPRSAEANNNMGAIMFRRRQYDEAKAYLGQTLRVDPRHAEALNNLGSVLYQQGQVDQAGEHFAEALRLEPEYAEASCNLGMVRLRQGRVEEARERFAEALRLYPRGPDMHERVGRAFLIHGRIGDALEQLTETVRLEPDRADALNDCAMIWATAADPRYRDGRRAVAAARRACELTGWRNPSFLDTLASACAEAGDFAGAVRWQGEALARVEGLADRRDFLARLELYRRGQPYHEAAASPVPH